MGKEESLEDIHRIPFGSSWDIQVDEAYAERMIRAHNKAYRRKTGKGFFVFCLLLDLLVIAGTVKCLADGLNLFDALNGFAGMIGAYVLFPGLTIFFGVLAFGPDKGGFFGRKRAARQLAEKFAPEGEGVMTARFDEPGVTLSTQGYVEHIPYAACYGTADVDGQMFVLVGSEKEQSVLYAAAGYNAYLRDNIGFAFATPPEFAASIVAEGERQFKRMREDEEYCNRVLEFSESGITDVS